MRIVHSVLLAAATMLVSACSDHIGTEPVRTDAFPSLSSTSESRGFYWLSPLEKVSPAFTGSFDATRTPHVDVLSCDGAAPCTVVASFNAAGSGAQKVTVDAVEEAYHVVWMAPATLTLGANRYRLRVSESVGAGEDVLGTADLAIVASKSEARKIPAPYFAVVRGSPLNIRFRLERNRVMPPVSAQLLPTGGSLEIPLGGGAQMTLEVPAGALTSPIIVTVTPQAPGANGALASVRMSPANLFFRKPARLTITLPATVPTAEARLLTVGSGNVGAPPTQFHPTTPVAGSDRRFMAELVVIGAPPSDAPLSSPIVAQTMLRSFPMAAAAVAAGEETELALVPADVVAHIKALENAVATLISRGDFIGAARVQNEATALRQLADLTSTTQLDAVRKTVCSAFTNVLDGARGGLKADFRALWSTLRPLIAWNAAAQAVGATATNCAPLSEFDSTVGALTNEFTDLYVAQTEPSQYASSARALEIELFRSLRARAFGGVLDQEALFGKIKSTIQLPLAKRFRMAAYKYCRSNGEEEQLSIGRLMKYVRNTEVDSLTMAALGEIGGTEEISPTDDFGFELSNLREDAEYCATRVIPVVQDPSGVRTANSPLGGTSPDTVVRTMSITALQNGLLDFTGLLGAQLCEDDAYGTETVEVRYNGKLVRTMNRIGVTGSYIRVTPDSYDVNKLAADGGVDIAAGGTFPLEFRRTGTRCGGYYADVNDAETTLFTVNLTIESQCAAAPRAFARTAFSAAGVGVAPATTAGCGSITLTPNSTKLGGGQSRQFDAVILGLTNTAVTWSATGGSITPGGVFTAGAPGNATVTARSVEDPSLFSTAQIAIIGGGLAISPTTTILGFGQSRAFTVTAGSGPFVWSTDAQAGSISSTGQFVAGSTEGEFGVAVSNGTFGAAATVVVDRYIGVHDGAVSGSATQNLFNINITRTSLRDRAYRMATTIDLGATNFGPCTFTIIDLAKGTIAGKCVVSDSFEEFKMAGSFTGSGLIFTADNSFILTGVVRTYRFELFRR